jgi:hypothetical protein
VLSLTALRAGHDAPPQKQSTKRSRRGGLGAQCSGSTGEGHGVVVSLPGLVLCSFLVDPGEVTCRA